MPATDSQTTKSKVVIEENVVVEEQQETSENKRNPERRRKVAFQIGFVAVGVLLFGSIVNPWINFVLPESTFLDTEVTGSASFGLSFTEVGGLNAIILIGAIIAVGILSTFIKPFIGGLLAFGGIIISSAAQKGLSKVLGEYTGKFKLVSQYTTVGIGSNLATFALWGAAFLCIGLVIQSAYVVWKNRADYPVVGVVSAIGEAIFSRLVGLPNNKKDS